MPVTNGQPVRMINDYSTLANNPSNYVTKSPTSETTASTTPTANDAPANIGKFKDRSAEKKEQETKGSVSTATELANTPDAGKATQEGAQNPNKVTSNAEKADTKPPLIPPNQFSKAKGMLSIPAPGAHVWVMFENGDPNYPIVLGAIYGQQDYQGIHDVQNLPATPPSPTPTEQGTPPPPANTDPNAKANGDSVAAADAMQRKWQGKKAGGYCWRGVKNGLLEGGVVDNYMPGVSARDAGPTLLKNGFKQINVTDPRQAPPGSVLVYSGGAHGHIEMKTSDGGFVSDYYSRNPPGPGRRLTGVYVK